MHTNKHTKIKYISPHSTAPWSFPGGTVGKEAACQCRRHRRQASGPYIRKIPWSRKRQPTPVFFLKEWTEEPGGLQSMGSQRIRHSWELMHRTLKSTTAGIQGLASREQARRTTDWRRKEMGDGRAEGSSAIGDGGQAAVSLMPDIDDTDSGFCWNQMHVHIFESSQFEDSYVGALLDRVFSWVPSWFSGPETRTWGYAAVQWFQKAPTGEWKRGRGSSQTRCTIRQVRSLSKWNSVFLGSFGSSVLNPLGTFHYQGQELGNLSTNSQQSCVENHSLPERCGNLQLESTKLSAQDECYSAAGAVPTTLAACLFSTMAYGRI